MSQKIKATKEKVAESKPSPVVYIGPTLRGLGLTNGTIFKNGHADIAAKIDCFVKGAHILFVTTSKFAKSTADLSDKTSVMAVMHSRVVAKAGDIK